MLTTDHHDTATSCAVLAQEHTDLEVHLASAIEVARQGAVLLKNDGLLPIRPDVKRIAVIGAFSHLGMVSGGGGSTLTDPIGGFALNIPLGGVNFLGALRRLAITGPSPAAELRKQFPKAEILMEPGESPADAAAVAKRAAETRAQRGATQHLRPLVCRV
jgi:beta-glucosidase